ncbi:hypothetical protein [Granulicella sp. S156]|uniref:hypothetical protein n=1 Tax=Granulicella sp. S156 TaxID=1747224 RepID=UPI00131CCEBB|nr:hypothetical protein [Granulicella sp. S156]
MSLTRRPVLTLIAAIVIGWVVWQPVRVLLFGGRVFSKGGRWGMGRDDGRDVPRRPR